jgi:hypothetical protein
MTKRQFSVVPAPPGWEAFVLDDDDNVVHVPVLAWTVQMWVVEDEARGDWLESLHAQPVLDGHTPGVGYGYVLKIPDGRIMNNAHEEFSEDQVKAELLKQKAEIQEHEHDRSKRATGT